MPGQPNIDAVLQSSSAPPMFPITRRNGRAALDGALIDYVLSRRLNSGATTVRDFWRSWCL